MDENERENCKEITTGDEEELEKEHFFKIVNAFRYYRTHALQRLKKSENYLDTLPKHHQILLSKYGHHLGNIKVAIDHNYEIIKLIIKDVTRLFDNVKPSDDHSLTPPSAEVTTVDMDKVQSTLKQFVRDWSEDGAEERKACYQPILDEIERLFPHNECRNSVSILVPGAGLGRLAHEIARRGYTCQGNEFSLFMLFASNFVLNKCHGVNIYRLYPWVHHYCNNLRSEDQVRYTLFPDVNPSDMPAGSQFSMAAGDFLEVYVEKDSWDCVATCFFLDTASNVVSYIETIWKILKPGAYWINLGPLLYHFADMPADNSVEPSYEDLVGIIKKIGFVFLKEDVSVKTTYAHNPFSMLKWEYRCLFFVCQKPQQDNVSGERLSR